MTVDQQELGRRLKASRTSCGLTQDDVARHLGLARSAVTQIELGNRAVTGLELHRLAEYLGRDMRDLLAESFQEDNVLAAIFRSHPEFSGRRDLHEALVRSLALGREITNLERLLEIDRDLGAAAAYPLPSARTKWDAIRQGERIAQEERRRLGLGQTPLPDVAELLEAQSVRTAQEELPESISGLTLVEPSLGVLVVTNRDHHFLRRRFSTAHEYCHVLVDRERRGLVSRTEDRHELIEVRANAFAACFLMPEEGVRQFVLGLGKGSASRLQREIVESDDFADDAVEVRSRTAPGSQDLQMYDVVRLAHHFGASVLSALFRLKSLRLLNEAQLDALRDQDKRGLREEIADFLGLPRTDHEARRNQFRQRFLGLALEAYRREEISKRKLMELADRVQVREQEVEAMLATMGIEEEAVDVVMPGP
jgi:Zn-dependent peptidase ImmA (M78 family)/DNA-binding XRE family transcriptional regulator